MSTLTRAIILTAILAFAAGLCGAWIGAQLFTPAHAPSLHALVHGEMKLSADQQKQMDAAEAAYKLKRKTLEQRIATANRRLAQAMQASETYSPDVETAVDDVHLGLGELQKETIKYVYDMRAILTPDQAKRLDDRVFEALTRDED